MLKGDKMFNFFKQREIKIENVGTLEKGKTYFFKVNGMPMAELERIGDKLGKVLKKCGAFGIIYMDNIEVILPKQEGDKNEAKNLK
jgi:hypothetical protein